MSNRRPAKRHSKKQGTTARDGAKERGVDGSRGEDETSVDKAGTEGDSESRPGFVGHVRRAIFPTSAEWKSLGRPLRAAIFFGLLARLGFPPVGFELFSFAGFILFFWFFGKKRRYFDASTGFWFAFAFGFVFYYLSCSWLNSLARFNWLAPLGIPILAAYLAFYTGLAGAAMGWTVRHAPSRFVLVAPVAWTLSELARSSGDVSFSFFLIGHLGHEVPQFLPGVGVEIYSLMIAFGCAFVAFAMQYFWAISGFTTRRDLHWAIGTAALYIAILLGLSAFAALALPTAGEVQPMKIALLQPNILQEDKWESWNDTGLRQSIVDRTFELADQISEDVALIVFPENTFPGFNEFLYDNRELALRVGAVLRRTNADIIISDGRYSVDESTTPATPVYYNTNFLLLPEDTKFPRDRAYDKRRLVPYGESIPFIGWIPGVKKLIGVGQFAIGNSAKALQGRVAIGQLVCFESAYPDLVEATIHDGGAQLFVITTNDGWFGRASALDYHWVHALFRAYEYQIPVVQAANTGITGIVDPHANTVTTLEPHAPGVLVGTVNVPGLRVAGDIPPRAPRLIIVLGGLALLGFASCYTERRRYRL